MSAFTAEHLERVRLANIAAAEVSHGLSCTPRVFGGIEALNWTGREHADVELRASLLSKMAVFGPDAESACPSHRRLYQWDACGKVSVASALLGRTCWKAQP